MKTRTKVVSPHSGGDVGWSVMTTLIGGFLVWGGIGLLLDRWLETKFLAPVGLIIGMGLGIYAIVARFGSSPDSAKAPATNTSGKALVSSPGAWRYAQLARKSANQEGRSSSTTTLVDSPPQFVSPAPEPQSSDTASRPTDPHRPIKASITRENECP